MVPGGTHGTYLFIPDLNTNWLTVDPAKVVHACFSFSNPFQHRLEYGIILCNQLHQLQCHTDIALVTVL